jgi:glycosyltransferase involved in cell wall biosynthesis
MEASTGKSSRDERACCAIIAALNEASRVGAVVRVALASRLFEETVVVDDGSSDDTAQAAEGAGARVLVHEHNRGKPQALLTALKATTSELVCFLDADLLGVTTEHLRALVEPVRQGKAEVTVGVFRGGRLATTLAQRISPLISGERCLRRALLDDFHEWNSGYGIETALNHHFAQRGIMQQLVYWDGAGQVMKEEKVGFLRGVVWRARMFWQIFVAWLKTKFGRAR